MPFVGHGLASAHMGAFTRHHDCRTTIASNRLNAHPLTSCRHPNLAVYWHIRAGHTQRVSRFVRPAKGALSRRIDQLLLALRIQAILLHIVIVSFLLGHTGDSFCNRESNSRTRYCFLMPEVSSSFGIADSLLNSWAIGSDHTPDMTPRAK